MKTLRNLLTLNRLDRAVGTRFDRYYGGIVRPGVGYPTADEARRDLHRFNRALMQHGWLY